MKSIYKWLMAAIMMPAALISCSDDDDFTAGPAPDPNCMSVFFPASNATSFTLLPDDSRIIPITIKRAKADQAASVPLNFTADLGGEEGKFIIPSNAEFAAGSDQTTVDIDCSELPLKKTCTLTLSLPDEYVNPYAAGTGSASFSVTLTGAWQVWGKDVKFTFSSYYGTISGDIMAVEGTNMVKFVNFMNSGLDLPFQLTGSDFSTIYPTDNFISYNDAFGTTDDAYNCWLLFDTANNTYPVWAPDGSDNYIYNLITYGWNSEYTYSYIYPKTGTGALYFQIQNGNGGWEWNPVTFEFTPLFEM